ncbi:hypothetical protein HYI36_14895 [Bacillus sp. Gen3]|nr:hypothetical protein [Bacillus sp. Gen3]
MTICKRYFYTFHKIKEGKSIKLVPVIISDLPLAPVEWRFKKHKVQGKILYLKKKNCYVYFLNHPSFKKEINSETEGNTYKTLEDARIAAEKWIDLWYSVQGRILSFGAF